MLSNLDIRAVALVRDPATALDFMIVRSADDAFDDPPEGFRLTHEGRVRVGDGEETIERTPAELGRDMAQAVREAVEEAEGDETITVTPVQLGRDLADATVRALTEDD